MVHCNELDRQVWLVTLNKQDLKNNTALNVLFQFQTIGRFPKCAPWGSGAVWRVLRESAEPFSNDFNFSINELLNKYFLFTEIRGCIHCELSLWTVYHIYKTPCWVMIPRKIIQKKYRIHAAQIKHVTTNITSKQWIHFHYIQLNVPD
jgi:hypothetical protein